MQPTVIPLPVRAEQSSLARRAGHLLRPFWVVPATWCLLAVAVGLVLPSAESSWLPGSSLVFEGGAEGARTMLSTIAGAMISVTGLVFSITMVVLQLASSQYSPRVLQAFLGDRTTQHTLGLFAASFVYALVVLRAVRDGQEQPGLAISLAFLLVLGAVGMFLAYIHHIATSIGVARILQNTAQQSRDLLADGQSSQWPTTPPVLEEPQGVRVLAAPRSGYVDALDTPALVRVASRHGVRIELLQPLGAFVAHGSPLLAVHELPGADTPSEEAVLALVSQVGERTMDQDLGYGIRRLVDIAERALSPGINDPTTAVQVLDQLHDLLRRMVTAPATWPVRSDEEGTVRLVLRQPTLADVVEQALADIAHWGEDHRRVRERIATIMDDLRAAALDEHRVGLG
ncbi:MAG: DUF2254 domain-containing protein [Nocardioides sp.]